MHSTLNIMRSNDPILVKTNEEKDDIAQNSIIKGEQEIVTDLHNLQPPFIVMSKDQL